MITIFYCRHPHSKLVLLACLLAPERPLRNLLTLDRPTLEKLQRRNELLAMRGRRKLTVKQEKELKKLRTYLDDLGFSQDCRDPMYERFLQMMYEVRSQPLNKLLSEKELKQQEALAKKIVTKIVKLEKTEQLSNLAKELRITAQNQ